MAQEANAKKAMLEASNAMNSTVPVSSEEKKDRQIELANGIMLANAVHFGMMEIARAIEKLKK